MLFDKRSRLKNRPFLGYNDHFLISYHKIIDISAKNRPFLITINHTKLLFDKRIRLKIDIQAFYSNYRCGFFIIGCKKIIRIIQWDKNMEKTRVFGIPKKDPFLSRNQGKKGFEKSQSK